MIKSTPGVLKVMGSLDRDQSKKLANDILSWTAEIPKVIAPKEKKLLRIVN